MEENTMTDKEITEELQKLGERYHEGLKIMEKEYAVLLEQQKRLPRKFAEKEDFEDYLILSSQLKHRSIQLNKNATALSGSLDIDYDYIHAQLLLYVAEDYLKDKFDKVTDKLRDNYVASKKDLKKLLKIRVNLRATQEAAEKLVRAFEGDEVNCRKFLDLKNKLKGL